MLTTLDEYSNLTEWILHEPKISTGFEDRGGSMFSRVTIALKIARDPEGYFWRIVLFMALISSCALTAFAIDPVTDG